MSRIWDWICGRPRWPPKNWKGTKVKGMVGKTYGQLTVLEESPERASNGAIIYLCLCVCGKRLEVIGTVLRRKKWPKHHCGCLKKPRVVVKQGPKKESLAQEIVPKFDLPAINDGYPMPTHHSGAKRPVIRERPEETRVLDTTKQKLAVLQKVTGQTTVTAESPVQRKRRQQAVWQAMENRWRIEKSEDFKMGINQNHRIRLHTEPCVAYFMCPNCGQSLADQCDTGYPQLRLDQMMGPYLEVVAMGRESNCCKFGFMVLVAIQSQEDGTLFKGHSRRCQPTRTPTITGATGWLETRITPIYPPVIFIHAETVIRSLC